MIEVGEDESQTRVNLLHPPPATPIVEREKRLGKQNDILRWMQCCAETPRKNFVGYDLHGHIAALQ